MEVVAVTTVNDRIVAELNRHAKERLAYEVDMQKLTKDQAAERNAMNRRHEADLAVIATRISRTDQQISAIIAEHRHDLFLPGKKSFTTYVASFALRTVPARIAVTDTNAIMSMARRRGVIRKIAIPVRKYTFNLERFRAWFAHCDELRVHFEQFVEDVPEHESLSMKPNDKNPVVYSGEHLTNRSITIQS